ncbi:hypothetical protein QJS10_CPB04g00253 [Acorus calamus]|uniref:Chlorophyll a-b binding protein, chloroplastic n=1 Tax=Acorus calamus TaxID=4465 RepID=A0AAV9EZZ4_ACOCL|nr:hypothetical protein QJS10_CPB04g00253 [Acorus calamus]
MLHIIGVALGVESLASSQSKHKFTHQSPSIGIEYAIYGRMVIRLADKFCTDDAGNLFKRTNDSVLTLHFDKRPLRTNLWSLIPSYELEIGGTPRTVLATNKVKDLQFFVDFSGPVLNSTKDIQRILVSSTGHFVPIKGGSRGKLRFVYQLRNVKGTRIITVEPQSASLIGQSGAVVTLHTHIVFLYVTVIVPEGKAIDIAGNLNSASNQLEVRPNVKTLSADSVPAISIALHSFITAGLLATSLASTILTLSSVNLAAMGAITTGLNSGLVSDPSRNLLGMTGHLQVFVMSDWISVNLPKEYSETMKGLRWLIPRGKLPWKAKGTSNSAQNPSTNHPIVKYGNSKQGPGLNGNGEHSINIYNSSLSELIIGVKDTSLGPPLISEEYFTYFLRGEPLSAANVVKSMENYTGWQDFEMNMVWLGIAGIPLLVMHFLILLILRWRMGTSTVAGTLTFPRFELFLLILMLPCIGQSSAFVIKGGTTGGIIVGLLLLAIPAALLLSILLFFTVSIFMGGFFQYKEIMLSHADVPWHDKLWFFFVGRPTIGKWFLIEGVPPSFIKRFGILFEDRKGPPIFVSIDHNDPNNISKWTKSGESGIGRMRSLNSDNGHEDSDTPLIEKLLGCIRSMYLSVDLIRRVGLGIISSAYPSSNGQNRCVLAFGVTLAQFLYLFIFKPYIRRGVQLVETMSLLCELGVFGISIYIDRLNTSSDETSLGIAMLVLLFISFISQLVNEWYALIRFLLRLPQSTEPCLKHGLKWVARGLVLPLLPRKHWPMQPETGLAPVVPMSPSIATEVQSRDTGSRRMSAAVVPVSSPQANEGSPMQARPARLTRSITRKEVAMHVKSESKNDMKKLREMAKASFSGIGRKREEGSTSYVLVRKNSSKGGNALGGSFLVGRRLRQSRSSAAAASEGRRGLSVSAAAASGSGSERPLWFPGSTPPPWLDGSLPGDFGFDPLGLGSDPESLRWNQQAEIVHCRWAMLGAAGIFIPELLTKIGILNTPSWYTAGEQQYFTDTTTLFVVELILIGWAEGRRWADILKPGCVNTDPIFPNNKLTGTDVGYPGGLWFDPLGWGSGSPEKIRELRTKEIKNGRLAMLAVMGAWFQAVYTGTGPIDNLFAHLADPGHATIFAVSVGGF